MKIKPLKSNLFYLYLIHSVYESKCPICASLLTRRISLLVSKRHFAWNFLRHNVQNIMIPQEMSYNRRKINSETRKTLVVAGVVMCLICSPVRPCGISHSTSHRSDSSLLDIYRYKRSLQSVCHSVHGWGGGARGARGEHAWQAVGGGVQERQPLKWVPLCLVLNLKFSFLLENSFG